jgi:hypothetical protein
VAVCSLPAKPLPLFVRFVFELDSIAAAFDTLVALIVESRILWGAGKSG